MEGVIEGHKATAPISPKPHSCQLVAKSFLSWVMKPPFNALVLTDHLKSQLRSNNLLMRQASAKGNILIEA